MQPATQATTKPLMTLEQVKEQYHDAKWSGIDVEQDDGSTVTVAFRAPRLIEYKQFMQEKDLAQVGDVLSVLNLMTRCCLTHDRKGIEQICDVQVGFMKSASEEIVKLMSTGISVTKKA